VAGPGDSAAGRPGRGWPARAWTWAKVMQKAMAAPTTDAPTDGTGYRQRTDRAKPRDKQEAHAGADALPTSRCAHSAETGRGQHLDTPALHRIK
jgi:hypothetical protein